MEFENYNSQNTLVHVSPTTALLRVDHVLCDCRRTAVCRKCRKTCHTVTLTQPRRQRIQQQQQQTCRDGLENYVPRPSPSCSQEFSMHCWRVSSGPWRRRRPNYPSERTIWRECVKPDSGRGESSGNSDKRTKLPPATGWGISAVKVNYSTQWGGPWIMQRRCASLQAGWFLGRKLGGLSPPASSPRLPQHQHRQQRHAEGGAHAAAALSCRVRVPNDIAATIMCCLHRVMLSA